MWDILWVSLVCYHLLVIRGIHYHWIINGYLLSSVGGLEYLCCYMGPFLCFSREWVYRLWVLPLSLRWWSLIQNKSTLLVLVLVWVFPHYTSFPLMYISPYWCRYGLGYITLPRIEIWRMYCGGLRLLVLFPLCWDCLKPSLCSIPSDGGNEMISPPPLFY